MSPDPEMRLIGDEDGAVHILCERKGCMVDISSPLDPTRLVWLTIKVPYDATPRVLDQMWMQHRLEHANRSR